MTSYVSMTSYTLTRPSLVTLWDYRKHRSVTEHRTER